MLKEVPIIHSLVLRLEALNLNEGYQKKKSLAVALRLKCRTPIPSKNLWLSNSQEKKMTHTLLLWNNQELLVLLIIFLMLFFSTIFFFFDVYLSITVYNLHLSMVLNKARFNYYC